MSDFELSGGALCLDFANTISSRAQNEGEKLGSYDDLLRWTRQTETLHGDVVHDLEREAGRHRQKARAAFERAVELREVLYRVFAARARGEEPPEQDLADLNAAVALAMRHLVLHHEDGRYDWEWARAHQRLDSMLWPVTRSAAELLTSEDADRVRECDSATCSWLFLDRSPAGRRRWCDMATCGNRAKARRYYRRQKREQEKKKRPAG